MYAPTEQIDQAEYASQITDKLFTFLEDYFQIRYALPKTGKTALDLIGITMDITGM